MSLLGQVWLRHTDIVLTEVGIIRCYVDPRHGLGRKEHRSLFEGLTQKVNRCFYELQVTGNDNTIDEAIVLK